jgi:hypothetical protein
VERRVTDTLDRALDRLLHDGALRRRFFSGDDPFALDDEDAAALRALDPAQLDAMAAMVREQAWRASHRGGRTLAEGFAKTVASWRRAHPDDGDCAAMVDAFVASPEFEGHRAVAHAGPGTCVEEAFYAWCSRERIGDPAAREREFMAAMARALTVCPDPDFVVPAAFRRVRDGWCAVSDGQTPTLYAAVRGRCMVGAVTPLVARILRGEAPDAASAHVADELRAMGLLD